MNAHRLLLLLLISVFLCCPGCGMVEVNDTAITVGLGADLRDEQILISAQLAKPVSPEQGSSEGPQFLTVTGSGPTATEAARSISLSFPRTMLWPHASLFILGEDLAKKDVASIIDFMARNRNIRRGSTLVISKGASLKEIMEAESYLETYPLQAVQKLLEIQDKELGIYTPIAVHEFLRIMAEPGIEAVVPQITATKSEDKTYLKLDGSAVFKGRKMVGELNEEDSQGYRWLQKKSGSGGLIVIPSLSAPDRYIALEVLRYSTKVEPELKNGQLKMKIELKADGNFLEQNCAAPQLEYFKITEIETRASAEIEKQILSCIQKAQGLESDIFGWGNLINDSNPALWKAISSDWDQYFISMPVDIKVEYKMRRTYLMDESFQYR